MKGKSCRGTNSSCMDGSTRGLKKQTNNLVKTCSLCFLYVSMGIPESSENTKALNVRPSFDYSFGCAAIFEVIGDW